MMIMKVTQMRTPLLICGILFNVCSMVCSIGKNNEAGKSEHHGKQSFIRNKQIKWTPQLKSTLKSIWHETLPGTKGHSSRMKAKWDLMFPEYNYFTAKYLRDNAVFWSRNNVAYIGMPGKVKVKWTDQMNMDLNRIWQSIPPTDKERARKTYEAWIEKYPQYRDLVAPYLIYQRACGMKTGRYKIVDDGETKPGYDLTRKYFKWTDGIRSELMKMWNETSPGNGRTQMLYNKWIEKYPQYAYLDPKNISHQARITEARLGLRKSYRYPGRMKTRL